MHLTKRQYEVLDFIRGFRERRGFSPTLEEIGEHFGVRRVTIHEHVHALERKGALHCTPRAARSLVPVGDAEARVPAPLPLVGRIAAGAPIEAVEEAETIDIAEMVDADKECYVLRVNGDSMIEEQIRDGDYVIVEKRDSADDGETVVALLDDGSATLKKIYREAGRVRLQPANPTMKPRFVDSVQVQGVVIGVLRKY